MKRINQRKKKGAKKTTLQSKQTGEMETHIMHINKINVIHPIVIE